jgi:hypothetical protein
MAKDHGNHPVDGVLPAEGIVAEEWRRHVAEEYGRGFVGTAARLERWMEIVKLAERIRADAAASQPIDAATGLELARAIRTLSSDEASSGIMPRPGAPERKPR